MSFFPQTDSPASMNFSNYDSVFAYYCRLHKLVGGHSLLQMADDQVYPHHVEVDVSDSDDDASSSDMQTTRDVYEEIEEIETNPQAYASSSNNDATWASGNKGGQKATSSSAKSHAQRPPRTPKNLEVEVAGATEDVRHFSSLLRPLPPIVLHLFYSRAPFIRYSPGLNLIHDLIEHEEDGQSVFGNVLAPLILRRQSLTSEG